MKMYFRISLSKLFTQFPEGAFLSYTCRTPCDTNYWDTSKDTDTDELDRRATIDKNMEARRIKEGQGRGGRKLKSLKKINQSKKRKHSKKQNRSKKKRNSRK
jgi:hypothetical protein